jgi:hypothetical protein
VLVELSVMAQRYQAVLALVQDGWKVTEVAAGLGCVSAERARLDRPIRAGRPGCPGRPLPSSQRLPAPDRRGGGGADELRREQPGWGRRRIEHQLARREIDPVPARSSIYRCLRRHELIGLRRRRKRATNSGGGSGSGR